MRRFARPGLFVACALPLAWLVARLLGIVGAGLGANPIDELMDRLGEWGLRLLLATLCVTPLAVALRKPWLMGIRRMLGLSAFSYLTLHLLNWLVLDQLHFQYWREHRSRPETRRGQYIETMSFIGACWFMHRDRYWELDGLDEAHGSWGQVGTEVACKSWLSGGKLLTAKKTWFSHMFRTQGGDFGFPYHISGNDQDRARKYSQWLWKGGHWKKQVRPLKCLVDKFAPVPTWEGSA